MTQWFKRDAGESGNTAYDVSDEYNPEGSALLIANRPDWVKHPVTGDKLRCLDQKTVELTCPKCSTAVVGVVTLAEGGLCALDCPSCNQYVWFEIKT